MPRLSLSAMVLTAGLASASQVQAQDTLDGYVTRAAMAVRPDPARNVTMSPTGGAQMCMGEVVHLYPNSVEQRDAFLRGNIATLDQEQIRKIMRCMFRLGFIDK
ncbi:hypothetical protein [Phreatobacter stygius]|uniref:Uncharacterized protein n=1 Tax=Phreatobacter stygius TaxID=1940610 RepID=A0A4D7AWZ9_9HYPH|nr:hypothetical protein [Phreatobacter stygius]QCI64581.1 hypothetical protein E8M01_10280 [Phreatobacter stygius]